MARRHSLRFRVAFAFAALGTVLSTLLAVGIWFAAHDVSRRLMDQTLRAELEDYMARRARNPLSLPPATVNLRGYLISTDSRNGEIPSALRELTPGQHEIEVDAIPYRVAVAERAGERYLIMFNEERQRLREQRFLGYLAVAALLVTALSTIGGVWLAGRVIAPVTDLAHAVSAAEPDNPPRLAVAGEPDDELAELAGAFDRYLARLAAFLERERAFTADASHELRTPLAVIRSAAEVLADDPTLTPAQAGRIARIERAATNMAELISALLLLAREEALSVDGPCDASRIARECIDRHQAMASARDTALSFHDAGGVGLPVPPALFAIVVANLVHNALAHTEGGSVRVRLDSDGLIVTDTGVGIPFHEVPRVFVRFHRGPESSGSGIGLSLVKRICDRCGWRIRLENQSGGGAEAKLDFHS